MVDVALRPSDVRAADLAIVIDVLRATSTVTQALAAGYARVLCVASLDHAQALRGPGRVLAGERACVKPEGFDQGNSPIEALERRADDLVLATTNGTPAVAVAAELADTVLLGCMLNFDAVVRATLGHMAAGTVDVQIVCAGNDGAVSLEDAYVAGGISRRLPGPRTDAALVTEAVARAFRTPLEALSTGADARVLEAAGLSDDIAFCAQESALDVVPEVVGVHAGVAIAALRADAARAEGTRAVERLDPVGS